MAFSEPIFSPVDDPAAIIASVRQHGVALVRGAIPPAEPDRLRGAVVAFFAAREKDVAVGRLAEDRLHWLAANGLSGPSLSAELDGLFATLSATIARACAREYLGGDDIVIPTNHLLFRRRDDAATLRTLQRNPGVAHNFHQDHDLIPKSFPLNMWLPLSEIDGATRGLSFVFPTTTAVHPLPFDLDAYLAGTNGHLWSPDMMPGDLAIFHHRTIHGSVFAPGKTPRYSVEFRLGRKRDLPDDFDGPIGTI